MKLRKTIAGAFVLLGAVITMSGCAESGVGSSASMFSMLWIVGLLGIGGAGGSSGSGGRRKPSKCATASK